jgi:MmoB/DmpM family
MESNHLVGPVLQASVAASAVISAIRELNDGVQVADRGSYLRVSVEGRCVVTRRAIEAHIGRPFVLPGDLELIMPSFKGKLSMTEDEARWISTNGERSR